MPAKGGRTEMGSVLYEATDGVATITLNRPERRNAINRDLLDSLGEALDRAAADAACRIVYLRGAGAAFCAGDDLEEFARTSNSEDSVRSFVTRLQNVTRRLMLGHQTVVCGVQGWVVGGGTAWPLNADLALWADDARLKLPEATYGLMVSGGVSILLAELCGPQRANNLMLSGETLDADQLQAKGIAPVVVACGSLEGACRARIAQLLGLPDGTLERFKRCRAESIRTRLEAALPLESAALVAAALDPRVSERLPARIARRSV